MLPLIIVALIGFPILIIVGLWEVNQTVKREAHTQQEPNPFDESLYFEGKREQPSHLCPIVQALVDHMRDNYDNGSVIVYDEINTIEPSVIYEGLVRYDDSYEPRNRHKPKRDWYSKPGVHKLCKEKEHNSKKQRYPYRNKSRNTKDATSS